ncbi:MAG: hypothetical protein JRD89_09850 [Deltaproteobacteria bacterium]|nr:hypothetical protein [Deltaproteobacteria bacterium]
MDPYLPPYSGDPVIGGAGLPEEPTDWEPTPSITEKQWQVLLERFGVDEEIQKRLWSILNVHMQLGKVQSFDDLLTHLIHIENIIRVSTWDDEAPPIEYYQLEQIRWFVEWLIRKSVEGGTPNERVLLISNYGNITHRYEDHSPSRPPERGILGKLLKRGGN